MEAAQYGKCNALKSYISDWESLLMLKLDMLYQERKESMFDLYNRVAQVTWKEVAPGDEP